MVIVSDAAGNELRVLKYNEYDFEVGDNANDFQIKVNAGEWESIPNNARIYIPGTEYGGIYKRTEVDTKQGYIAIGGVTWRGMLQNHIIEPPEGVAYASDSGDLNAIIGDRVYAAFGDFFTGGTDATVEVEYQYNRYVSLYDGLQAMCSKAGYRLRIVYDHVKKRVVVDAVPIVDYSNKVEFSTDMQTNYFAEIDNAGVNHLICLGSGQLANRTVIHLYSDQYGRISTTQTFFGVDEIARVYDYSGADVAQLTESGISQFKSIMAKNSFSVDVRGLDLEIGDIVGGKDYVTGISMKAPVTGKIIKYSNGAQSTEYTISDNVEVQL